MFTAPWAGLGSLTTLFPVLIYGLAISTIIRFVKIALRLYCGSRLESVVDTANAKADPDDLAAFAIGSGALCKEVLPRCMNSEAPSEEGKGERTLLVLRKAETRFLYLWETCDLDVESSRTTSLSLMLLSFPLVGVEAFWSYMWFCEFRHIVFVQCLIETARQLLLLYSSTFGLGSIFYLASGFFKRVLTRRKRCWNYFCAVLRSEFDL